MGFFCIPFGKRAVKLTPTPGVPASSASVSATQSSSTAHERPSTPSSSKSTGSLARRIRRLTDAFSRSRPTSKRNRPVLHSIHEHTEFTAAEPTLGTSSDVAEAPEPSIKTLYPEPIAEAAVPLHRQNKSDPATKAPAPPETTPSPLSSRHRSTSPPQPSHQQQDPSKFELNRQVRIAVAELQRIGTQTRRRGTPGGGELVAGIMDNLYWCSAEVWRGVEKALGLPQGSMGLVEDAIKLAKAAGVTGGFCSRCGEVHLMTPPSKTAAIPTPHHSSRPPRPSAAVELERKPLADIHNVRYADVIGSRPPPRKFRKTMRSSRA